MCAQIPDALRKFSFHAFFPLKALNRKQVQLGLLLHQGDLCSFWSSLPIQKYTIKKERKEEAGGKRVVENLGVSRCDIYKMWLPYGAAPPQPRTVFNYGNFALIIIVNKALLGYYLKKKL